MSPQIFLEPKGSVKPIFSRSFLLIKAWHLSALDSVALLFESWISAMHISWPCDPHSFTVDDASETLAIVKMPPLPITGFRGAVLASGVLAGILELELEALEA